MTQIATPFSPTHAFDVEEQRFLDVLDSLRQWTSNNEGQHGEKRTTERMAFFGNPFVVLSGNSDAHGQSLPAISVRVWGRDLSRSGLSFLMAREVVPTQPGDGLQPALMDESLRNAAEVTVGLGQVGGDLLWLAAEVLRLRPLADDLFECGVGFLRRCDGPPA